MYVAKLAKTYVFQACCEVTNGFFITIFAL